LGFVVLVSAGGAEEKIANRPRVPGQLRFTLRRRLETPPGSGKFAVQDRQVLWNVADTAIIVCDMWDNHWCASAAERVSVMAPRMNEVLSAARSHGVMIIHAPSDTMDFYKDTPYRRRLQQARPVKPPVPIGPCRLDSSREPPLPIDDSDGGCDDPTPPKSFRAWKRQHPAIDVIGYDGVSDSGHEIFSFCKEQGITNVAIMGVHTNMCVLGRSFGIRQMVRLGMNVVLVRDLTDAMYDPRDRPQVSHTRGTQLVVEHVEKYWCPSIEGAELTAAAEGTAGPVRPLATKAGN
jgi:nicotinamidase-related amidase